MTAAANPRHGRPPRQWLAAGLAAGLLVLLFASSLLSARHLGRAAGSVAVLGLPTIGAVAVATLLVIRALEPSGEVRRRRLALAAAGAVVAVLLWLLVVTFSLFTMGAGPLLSLVFMAACVPTTGFGLWALRRLDRNDKEPWRLVLVAVAWGAVGATSLVIWANTYLGELADSLLVPGPGLEAAGAYGAGFFEEIAKGVAVLLLYLVMRDEFDDVVDGIIYGAAVGLGFNFMETVLYMNHLYAVFADRGALDAGFAAGFQWYARQVLGLFSGHATYTALVGAGIGIARQLAGRRRRVLVIAAGWVVAIAAHFSWDAWLQFFPVSSGLVALLQVHLRTLFMEGPFTAAVLVLLFLGLRMEGAALRRQLALEAETGLGAVVPAEVAVLASPGARLRARLGVLSRFGPGAYLRLRRLQHAQLALAMERWHRERREIDTPLEAEAGLRERVIALRG